MAFENRYSRSSETQLAVDLLRTYNDDVLTFEYLETVFGRPVDDKMKNTMRTARGIVERDYNLVWDSLHGVGYRRLNDVEKVKSLNTYVRRISSAKTRGSKRSYTVERPENMSLAEQQELTMARSIFELVANATAGYGNKK